MQDTLSNKPYNNRDFCKWQLSSQISGMLIFLLYRFSLYSFHLCLNFDSVIISPLVSF